MSSTVDWSLLGAWSPERSLKRAADAKWLVDGVIPAGGITWLVASPESFKTFVALDIAAAIARGAEWHGRGVKPATALFIAAEGGENVHVRRAAADLAAGTKPGPLAVVQLRPRLDEPCGLVSLQALLYAATGGYGHGLKFQAVDTHESFEYRLAMLSPEERAEYELRLSDDESFDDGTFVDAAAASRFGPIDRAIDSALRALTGDGPTERPRDRIFLVIDTFSQTCADDTKATVSRYIKTLRDLQDQAAAQGCEVTVLVIDHTTKSGDTYMGSGAKEGDPDAMLELERHGDSFGATLRCTKMKDAAHFQPVHLELRAIEIPGFPDAQGRPLTSLRVVDGEQAHRIRKVIGTNSDTAAALLLGVIDDIGPTTEPALRQAFLDHPTNMQKSAETKARSFRRAFASLRESGAVHEDDNGLLTAVLGGGDE
jgi:hypothetical protein